jgi:hypothetical protein
MHHCIGDDRGSVAGRPENRPWAQRARPRQKVRLGDGLGSERVAEADRDSLGLSATLGLRALEGRARARAVQPMDTDPRSVSGAGSGVMRAPGRNSPCLTDPALGTRAFAGHLPVAGDAPVDSAAWPAGFGNGLRSRAKPVSTAEVPARPRIG